MTISQANVWAANNIKPEENRSEIMPTEPYLLGSHSGCCGLWVSGPDEDWVPEEYKIRADNGKVYNRMTTVNVETGKLTMFKRPLIKLIPDKSLEFFSALGT